MSLSSLEPPPSLCLFPFVFNFPPVRDYDLWLRLSYPPALSPALPPALLSVLPTPVIYLRRHEESQSQRQRSTQKVAANAAVRRAMGNLLGREGGEGGREGGREDYNRVEASFKSGSR